jgi:hypothetical protein
MMALSKETSCEGHLLVVPATPVQVIVKLLQKLTISDYHLKVRKEDIDKGHGHSGQGALNSDNETEADGDGGDVGKQSNREGGSGVEDCGEGSSSGLLYSIKVIKKAIDILSKGALAGLVSSKPMT